MIYTLSLKWICTNYIFHNYFYAIFKYCKIYIFGLLDLRYGTQFWVRATSS